MAIVVKKTGDILATGVKCLVYGRAGIGKTKLMGTAPNPIIISCESGLLSLKNENVDYITINSVEQLEEAYDFVVSSEYQTVCLDSISEIAEVLLSSLKSASSDKRQAYGETADVIAHWIRKFRDIDGKHVVFSAKMERREDADTGVTSYVPSMPGNTLKQGLSYFFDEVFFMTELEDDGTKFRALQTSASLKYDGKDRSGNLKKVEKPDLTHIFNRIGGK